MKNQTGKTQRKALILSACLAVCLMLFAFTAHADGEDVKYPYVIRAGDNTSWIDFDYGVEASENCLEAMKENGLYGAIQNTWSGTPSAKVGWAIACLGPGAGEAGVSASSGGFCPFYVDPRGDYSKIAEYMGLAPSELYRAMSTSLETCAKAGYYLMRTHMDGTYATAGDEIGAVCLTAGGGQYRQYNLTQSCSYGREVMLAAEYLEALDAGGPPDIEKLVQKNPEEEDYASVTVNGSSSGVTKILKCHDKEGNLAKTLATAAEVFKNKRDVVFEKTTKEIIKSQIQYPLKGGRNFIRDKWCLGRVTAYLEELQELWKMLSSGDGSLEDWVKEKIKEALAKIKEELLNAACEYVMDAIDIFLESICIPFLPDYSLAFIYPDLPSVSCNGLSLGDYISVSEGSTSLNALLDLPEDEENRGVPPTDPMSFRTPSLSLIQDVLRPSRSNGTVLYE